MSNVFYREGLGWRFDPPGVPASFYFSRFDGRDNAEVEVDNHQGEVVFRRRINLLETGSRGAAADLAADLKRKADQYDWLGVLQAGCESVLIQRRSGREVRTISGAIERPPPVPWLVQDLLLKGKINCWLGAASTGKSTLAKMLCVYYACGARFLGREMEQGVPLYLDFEDDEDALRRVVYDVCKHLGVWPVPPLHWIGMHGARLSDQVEMLARTIDQHGVDLMVVDALAPAAGVSGEMSYEAIALELESSFGLLLPCTILALDHITSAEHKDPSAPVPIKGRGAERKLEFIRNQWTLMRDDVAMELSGRHVVSWYHTKINALKKGRPFETEVLHRDGDLSVVTRDMQDAPSLEARQSKIGRYVDTVRHLPGLNMRELCERVEGLTEKPTKSQIEGARIALKRAEAHGVVRTGEKDGVLVWFAVPPETPNGRVNGAN